ncbi:MAG: radical SAM protein [Myxococcota bacterium]
MRPVDLIGLLADRSVGCTPTEARQVLSRVISDGSDDPTPRRAPRRALVDALKVHTTWRRLEVVERVPDDEGKSVRYLFRSPDGALSEAVRIGLHKPDHFTVCLSSQVGCAMACAFCATGRLGLTRNLESWEIVSAFLTVRDEAPGRVSGAVFMGQGEPLHSFDAVIQAARVLSDPCGGRIAKENITISTVGLVPQIRRYTRERHPYKLIVSLTSAIPERRAALLPVAGRTELAELVDALREYAASAPGRVTVAWVVMGGVNTGDDEVAALKDLLGDLPLRVNLIDVNDPRPDGFRRATPAELRSFLDRLQVLHVPVVRRYSVGQEQHSACGMLAARATGAA